MPDVSFKPIKGSTAGIAAKPIVNGQILFDTDKKSISLDILLNNVPTRIEMTKQDTFDGTQAEWEALSDAQKAQFVHVNITDDYSNPLYAFTGATASTDGAAGIVPKPLAGDQNKYLKGDGTWGVISAGSSSEGGAAAHNIPRAVPKDITEYITDGSFYNRLNGTGNYELYDDIYVGDYIHMSRAITSPYEANQSSPITGSEYVTIIGLDSRMNTGSFLNIVPPKDYTVDYHHAVMAPGKGFGGVQHFGRGTIGTAKAYGESDIVTTYIGGVTSSGNTENTATINQQLYAEFGSHLKTTAEQLVMTIDSNTFKPLTYQWVPCQAILMSEIEVFGTRILSDNSELVGGVIWFPLFRYDTSAINAHYADGSGYGELLSYYLKDLYLDGSSHYMINCTYRGCPTFGSTGNPEFIRPRFILAS